jgi:hypothetical protein
MTDTTRANLRKLLIDFVVKESLGLDDPVWWDEQNRGAGTPAYREWALAQEPTLRAELEAMSDDELAAECERFCDELMPEVGWPGTVAEKIRQEKRQEKLTRQYHRTIARQGGRSHRSAKQPPQIIEACMDMRATDPTITARQAYDKLKSKTGHRPTGG